MSQSQSILPHIYVLKSKTLSVPKTVEQGVQNVNGVRFVWASKNSRGKNQQWYINVNDFFKFFGYNVTTSVEVDDGLSYLVVK